MCGPDCLRLREICGAPCCSWDNGDCPLWDPKTKLCKCYKGRPLACRRFDCRVKWPERYAEWIKQLEEGAKE